MYGFDEAEWADEPLIPPGSKDKSDFTPVIASLQAQVNSGAIDREAAIANVVLTMGFEQKEAEALFPKVKNAVPNQSDNSQPQPVADKTANAG